MNAETGQVRTLTHDGLLELAKNQKQLIWFILFEIVICLALAILVPESFQSASKQLFFGLGMIGCYLVYKVAKALEMSTVKLVIAAVFLFVPLIGLITLLYINGKATKVLRQNGLRVGFMGAKRKDLEQLTKMPIEDQGKNLREELTRPISIPPDVKRDILSGKISEKEIMAKYGIPAKQLRDILSGQYSKRDIMIKYAMRAEELEEIYKTLERKS